MKLQLIIYHLVTQVTVISAANQYLGCFIDQIGDRDLSIFIGDYEQLTPKQCILACRAQNLPYAAIQYGNECRCAQQYGKYGQASEEECDYLCVTAEKCGGDYRNSVYKVVDSINQSHAGSSLLLEKVIRVKRAVAIDDSTQATDINSVSTTLTGSTTRDTASPTVMTASLTNNVSTAVHSSTEMSSVTSSTPIPSTNMGEISITTSHPNTSVTSTVTDTSVLTTTILRSASSSSVPQSSINPSANTISSGEVSSINSITSSPAVSSTYHTDTSEVIRNTAVTISSQTSAPTDTIIFTSPITSILLSNTIASNTLTVTLVTTHTDAMQSMLSSYTTQPSSDIATNTESSLIRTMISVPTSSAFISTESPTFHPLSSSSITSNNPASSPLMMTTEFPTASSLSPAITVETSVTTTTVSMTSTTTTASTTSSTATTITASTTSTTLTITTVSTTSTTTTVSTTTTTTTVSTTSTTTTVSTVTTTTVTTTTTTTVTTTTTTTTVSTTTIAPTYAILTIITVPLTTSFDPNNNTTRETVRTGLSNVVNLAFRCLTDSSYPNCTQSRQRIKRQLCSNGYNVDLISISEIASTSTSRRFLVETTVHNPCNQNEMIPAAQVRTAAQKLSSTTIRDILGYDYEGDLVRSDTNGTTDNPTTDRKLWLIGAVLGPVAFALLLIFIFCYLHYKCRPRPTNRTLTKVLSNAPVAAPPALNSETVSRENPVVEKDLHVLIQNDPLVGGSHPPRRLTPLQTEESNTDRSEHPVASELPMADIHRQNDVERWRNKLRLHEKFQQSSIPNTNRSEPYQYDNRTFVHDPLNLAIPPANGMISDHSPYSTPKSTEIEVGRTKLHRLLDEVLDRADSEEAYNPDSDIERQRRRRQRRRMNSISTDPKFLSSMEQIPHLPVIPQVRERPDPALVSLRYNPYEAGDRAHDIARLPLVELKPKYTTDDQHSHPYSSRSNPPLFFDDTTIPDRAATATDSYANPKRFGKTRVETDREALMRHDGGRVDRRQDKFNDDAVHINNMSKNRDGSRVQARTAWVEPDTDHDSFGNSEYHLAKRSVANTRNIISSIHNELQHISGTTSGDYHA